MLEGDAPEDEINELLHRIGAVAKNVAMYRLNMIKKALNTTDEQLEKLKADDARIDSLLGDACEDVRAACVALVASTGCNSERHIEKLIHIALSDRSVAVRSAAVGVLGEINIILKSTSILKHIIAVFDDQFEAPSVRKAAYFVIINNTLVSVGDEGDADYLSLLSRDFPDCVDSGKIAVVKSIISNG